MAADPERERRFVELVEQNRGRVERIARAYARGDWRDLQQEILLQLWRGLESFRGHSAPSTWLYRVALNTALTWRRRDVSSMPVSAAADILPDVAGETSPRDPLHVLQEFLGTLHDVDRAILLLYLEDASYGEISEVTGLSSGNVGVRLNRIKRAFIDRYIGD